MFSQPNKAHFCFMKEKIYLDNNSNTPVDPRVLKAMMPYLTNEYANASIAHRFGLNAH